MDAKSLAERIRDSLAFVKNWANIAKGVWKILAIAKAINPPERVTKVYEREPHKGGQ